MFEMKYDNFFHSQPPFFGRLCIDGKIKIPNIRKAALSDVVKFAKAKISQQVKRSVGAIIIENMGLYVYGTNAEDVTKLSDFLNLMLNAAVTKKLINASTTPDDPNMIAE